MADDTLFSHAAQADIGALKVYSTERTVTDYWIEIGERRFDALDVYRTLEETCCPGSGSYISNQRLVEALKKLGVIEHGGSGRWAMSAAKGPNYDLFVRHLEKLIPEDER